MLLAVSVGNSHITFGAHENGGWTRGGASRRSTPRPPTSTWCIFRALFLDAAGLRLERIDSAILSSVVPPLTGTMVETVASSRQEAAPAHPALDSAFASRRRIRRRWAPTSWPTRWPPIDRFRGNCIVVDFGTALSFTAVAAPGSCAALQSRPGSPRR